jgi:periplasmic protein TonB
MYDPDLGENISRQELVRWGLSGGVVLAAHMLFIVAVLARADIASLPAGSPVVMVDLAPIATAPSTVQSDQPPAPQVQTESEARAQQDTKQREKPPEEQVEETPSRKSDVELPQRTPDPPKQQQEEKVKQEAQDASHAAAPPNAAVTAALPAAPAPGESEQPTAMAISRWELSLAARLEAIKRYPQGAQGAKGIAGVAFRIDRKGHVLSSKVVKSSGSAILDEEALATLKRADPLPRPPDGIDDTKLSISWSIRFKLPKEH